MVHVIQSDGDKASQCTLARYAISTPRSSSPFLILTQLPHLLKVSDDGHVGVHVSVYTVLHAWLFAAIEFPGRYFRGDASVLRVSSFHRQWERH
jgi:hypothetical protein